MPTSQVRPSLRPPDGLGDGGKLLRRIRQIARGQAILGRAHPMGQIEILARERPPFFGMPSRFLEAPRWWLDFRDAPSQTLPTRAPRLRQ